jgi:hypothetical protein
VDWVGDVVFEDRRDVFLILSVTVTELLMSLEMPYLGEVALTVADEQTSLATTAVAHDDDLLRVRWWLRVLCGSGLAAAVRAVDGADCAFAIARPLMPAGLIVAAVTVVVGVAVLVRRHTATKGARGVCLGWSLQECGRLLGTLRCEWRRLFDQEVHWRSNRKAMLSQKLVERSVAIEIIDG